MKSEWGKASTSRILAQRQAIKKKFRTMYDEVLTIITRHDPIGIAGLRDEYEPEVDTMLPLLGRARSKSELRRLVHQEFVVWFGARVAGPETRYTGVASEIWDVWQTRRSGLQPR